MLSNNLKAFFYHLLWYMVVVAGFFLTNFKEIMKGIIPSSIGPVIFYAAGTVVFSTLFAMLFLKPQGSFASNISSCGLLIILDIFLTLGIAVAFVFEQITARETSVALLLLVFQLIIIQLILVAKEQ